MEFRWPMTARFCGIWILSPLINLNDMKYKKKRGQSQNFLDPRLLREREREREREMVPVKLFHIILTSTYVVQTAERVYT